MNDQIWKQPLFILFAFMLTMPFLKAQYVLMTHQPMCYDYVQGAGICSDLPTWTYRGYCTSLSPPAICVCSSTGTNLDGGIYCNQTAGAQSRGAAQPQSKKLALKDLVQHPAGVMAAPFAGSNGCTIKSGKHPLVITSAPRQSQHGAVSRGAPAKQPKKVQLCKENCKEKIQWSVKLVAQNDQLQGFHIQPVDQENQYLALTEDNELELVGHSDDMTELDFKRTVWHVGAGDFAGEAITGYRIQSGANLLYGLAVDKKSGELGACEVFQMSKEKNGDQEKVSFRINQSCNSVWNFDDCQVKDNAPADK